MGATPASMGPLAVILFALAVFSDHHLVTGEEAERRGTLPAVGGYAGVGGRWRPGFAPMRAKEWRPIFAPDRAYYAGEGGGAGWTGEGQPEADAWETGYPKRSPNCMSKCVTQGQIHPIMCHSLC